MTRLTAQAEVVDIRTDDEYGAGAVELRITTTNQDGVEVFTGEATAAIDWPAPHAGRDTPMEP